MAKAQGLLIVILVIAGVAALALGYSALFGNKVQTQQSIEQFFAGENTTIAKVPNANSAAFAKVTYQYNPQENMFLFECNGEGFSPEVYTWNFGDGSAAILSTSRDVFYQFERPGTYKVQCSAANSENLANASVMVKTN